MFLNKKYTHDDDLIFIAAKNNDSFMVEFLIRNGVDVNSINNDNESLAIQIAKYSENSTLIKNVLMNPNININVYDNNNEHLIFLLINNNNAEMAKYIILEKNIDCNIKNNVGVPLIYVLLQKKWYQLSKLLLTYDIDTNVKIRDNEPIIFKLIREENWIGAILLLDTRTVNVNNKSFVTKMTLIELVVENNLYYFFKFLLSHYNIILPKYATNGKTLIEIAARNNNTLILYNLIHYEMARIIQKVYRGYKIRKI